MSENIKKYTKAWCSVWSKSNSLYVQWAEKHGVNYYVMMVIYALDREEPLTQKEISDYCGISKQTVNGVIRNLKKDGWVILSEETQDRRAKKVSLTQQGKQRAKAILEPLDAAERNVMKNIEPQRVEIMLETIRLYNILFEKEME